MVDGPAPLAPAHQANMVVAMGWLFFRGVGAHEECIRTSSINDRVVCAHDSHSGTWRLPIRVMNVLTGSPSSLTAVNRCAAGFPAHDVHGVEHHTRAPAGLYDLRIAAIASMMVLGVPGRSR